MNQLTAQAPGGGCRILEPTGKGFGRWLLLAFVLVLSLGVTQVAIASGRPLIREYGHGQPRVSRLTKWRECAAVKPIANLPRTSRYRE